MNRFVSVLLFIALLAVPIQVVAGAAFPLLEAVKLSLKYNNMILIQKENQEIARGNIKVAQSDFDIMVRPSAGYTHSEIPILESVEDQNDRYTTGINISRNFRTGIAAGMDMGLQRIDSLDTSRDHLNSSIITFSLKAPLLEGLGVEVADAHELAARSNLLVTKYNFLHTVSSSIYQTIVYYWNYLLAVENLRVYGRSLERTRKLFKQVSILIEKDERPRSDIEQISASLADKQSSLYRGEQDVIAARNNLASYIGMPCQSILTVSDPVTAFPTVSDPEVFRADPGISKLVAATLERRYDYLALRQARKTDEINLVSALDKLRNTLDLDFNVSYRRLKRDENFGGLVSSLWYDKPGFNLNILLNYEWPVENSYARGVVQKYKAILKQNTFDQAQMERNIFANINSDISDLRKSSDSLKEREKSLAFYNKAIANEKKKYALGMSTIIDVINLEDKLVAARLKRISAQYQLAIAIIKFKYETGQLIHVSPEDKNLNDFDLGDVFAVNGMFSSHD